ncbi:MAG: TrmB family transcriptional regulator [Candidatus Pacearchaeota archaeon]
MEIIKALKKFGLSDKEAETYIACLNLGTAKASVISLKSNIPRTLTYDILERLIESGLVSYSIKGGKKYFSANSPKELKRILEEKEEAVDSVLPELEKLQKEKESKKPIVEIYEGIEGMKTVMDNILRSGVSDFYAYGSSRSSY